MNKRLIILSSDENGSFNNNYFFIDGISTSESILIARTSSRKSEIPVLTDEEIKLVKTLGPGDGVLLADPGAFSCLRQYFHFGIRNENFSDCCKLKRLSIEGGAFVKCIGDDKPKEEDINYFLSPEFTQQVNFNFKHKILHNVQESINMINYMDSLPEDTNFGFDYEASGMPLDKWFEISGASLCNSQFGGFISFTDCRHNNTPEEYQELLKRLGEFLEKRQRKIWVYNMQYEFQVSHRMLGVTLYNLCDASTINVLDGNHLKKYSLKWTAQNILGVNAWDTEFDRISDLIDEMLFTTTGTTKKDKQKILKVDQSNFKNTPEWTELSTRYPSYVKEFESLILEYWGNPFMCIPSDILGYYCNLDAFYTLMLYESKKNEYSTDAFETFLDNSRLGSLLHSSGLYIDENFRLQYHNESLKMMAWGITYCATARCKIKMNTHSSKMANIKKFHPTAQKLIRDGKFFNADPLEIEITKYILSSNIDTMDAYDTGVNEGSLRMSYGDSFAGDFMDIVRSSMTEVKMKTKIDEGIVKKKKILGIIAEKLKTLIGLDSIKVDNKLIELEKYMYYEKAYKELRKISSNQLKDINNIPEKIYAFGSWLTLGEYSEYISKNLFMCTSPEENDLICHEFAELYKYQTAFLAAILDSTQQLKDAEKFYQNLGIDSIEKAFEHFLTSTENYYNSEGKDLGDYPEKVYNLSREYLGTIKTSTSTKTKADGTKKVTVVPQDADQVKEIWSNFNGFVAQAQFFGYVNGEYLDYGKPFDESDLQEDFKFMRKLVINYLLYKKYAKVLSTYIDGMFKANNKWVIEGEDHIPLREADPGEPGAVEKCFVHYEVNTKSSKRWSSGFHTIISHADLKDCIVTPPSWDENGNIIYGGSDYVLTYFDIKY